MMSVVVIDLVLDELPVLAETLAHHSRITPFGRVINLYIDVVLLVLFFLFDLVQLIIDPFIHFDFFGLRTGIQLRKAILDNFDLNKGYSTSLLSMFLWWVGLLASNSRI